MVAPKAMGHMEVSKADRVMAREMAVALIQGRVTVALDSKVVHKRGIASPSNRAMKIMARIHLGMVTSHLSDSKAHMGNKDPMVARVKEETAMGSKAPMVARDRVAGAVVVVVVAAAV